MWWFVGAAAAGDRLEDGVRPVAQRVEITVDPAKPETTGRTVLTVEVTRAIDGFSLHADELALGAVTVGRPGRKARPATATAQPNGQVRIDPAKPLKPGTYELVVPFTGSVHARAYGLYRFDVDGQPYVASQFEADDARTAWPCFDEPSFKVPLELVVTAPEGLAVIANAPVATRAGTVTTFARTKPIPTYATALLVGPYVPHPVEGQPFVATLWTVEGHDVFADGIAADLAPTVAALQPWFGTPQPYEKIDWVMVPEFTFGAMENPGVIVANETYVPPDALATPEAVAFRTHAVAHELAHLWFGDLVTMAWWDDLWLNEGFAEWLGRKISSGLHPEYRGDVARVNRLAGMMGQDGLSSVRPLRVPVDANAVFETVNFAVYPKGEALLDMVEAWLGPDTFQRGLRLYLERHAWGNATAADLFGALSEASGQDVGGVLGAYLDTPGVPWVHLERAGTDAGSSDSVLRHFHVTQGTFALRGAAPPPGGPWKVPLRMRVGRPDGSTEVVTRVVDGEADLDLGDATWVLPAADGVGYYVWSLGDAELDRLLAALPALSPPERRGVLAMLELEHAAGARTLADVQRRLPAFADESDPAVLGAVRAAVLRVNQAERLGDPALEAAAHAYVRERLRPMLDRVGKEPVAGEPIDRATLRADLLTALAHAGDPDVRAYGVAVGRQVIADPRAVAPALAEFGLAALAESGAAGVQDELSAAAAREADPTLRAAFLTAYGRVGGTGALTAALDRAYGPDTPLADFDVILTGVRLRDREDEGDLRLDRTLASWDQLQAKLPPVMLPMMGRTAGGCSVARVDRAKAFFADRAVPGMDHVLADVEADVRACAAALEADAESLRTLFPPPPPAPASRSRGRSGR